MSNFEMWLLIVGFVLPPVLALLQQVSWPSSLKSVVALAACAVAGAGTAYFQGDLTGKRFVEGTLVVFVATISAYHGFWKPTNVAPEIEKATSLQ